MKLPVLSVAALFLLCGCKTMMPGGGVVNIGVLPEKTLEVDTQNEPSDSFRVVMTGFENTHGAADAKNSANKAESKLRRSMLDKGVEIVDVERKLRTKLTNEIQLIEAGGTSNFTLPEAANLAVRGEVSSATMDSSFRQEEKNQLHVEILNSKTLPARCIYTAKIEGILVFYKVDPVAKYRTVAFSGSQEETIPGSGCPALDSTRAQGLYDRAADAAIDDAESKILNVLARKGYVASARENVESKTVYYRLSIKPQDGAKPGVGVQFMGLMESGDGSMDEIPFAEGEIACTNHVEAAYAEVSDPNAIARIKKNTPVRLKFADGSLSFGSVDFSKLPFGGCNP